MTFNPATSLFSTASGNKSLAFGPLTPKSHESQSNILRPQPLRSRFFRAADAVTPAFKPWDDDKENYTPKGFDGKKIDGKGYDGRGFGGKGYEGFEIGSGRTFGAKVFDVFNDNEKRCPRCYDKATFLLEPCGHSYLPTPVFLI